MVATALTPIDVPANYATAGKTVTFTAGDDVNGNSFVSTGREVLIAQNTDVAAQTVTVASQPDEKGRTGDITADSIAAGAFRVYQKFPQDGWADENGLITVTPSDPAIKFAVLRLRD